MITDQYYKNKAKASFTTKLNLFLFSKAIFGDFQDFSFNDFHSFSITMHWVKLYTAYYWQKLPEETLFEPEYPITVREIENTITKWYKSNQPKISELEKDYIVNHFPEIFPIEDFKALLKNSECCYCHITVPEIEALALKGRLFKKNFRGWSLEVDRMNSNFEYSKENCVLACYWCNNAKTDEFDEIEFTEIGKVIQKIWQKRALDSGLV